MDDWNGDDPGNVIKAIVWTIITLGTLIGAIFVVTFIANHIHIIFH
jgi:hypothetical protein